MNVAIVAVAFLLPDALRAMVRSAKSRRHRLQLNLFLHSAIPEVRAACEELAREYPTVYHPYGTNRGLALTWNDAVLGAYGRGAGLVLIVNDDIVFSEGDVDRIVECAADNRDAFLVTCAGWHARQNRRVDHHAFSCFALNPIALEVLGCFDQNIAPAYFEDCDYMRRAELAGLREAWCTETDVLHAGSGSCYLTDETAQAAAEAHYTNSVYFRGKWGIPEEVHIGDWQGHCRYERPFNNPAFGLRIAPEDRHFPYNPPWVLPEHELPNR